jgi:HSP20 family protein
MSDRTREAERVIFLRREAEKIVRDLFQPEGAAAGVRLVADLFTDGDRFVLEVEVPGVDPASLQVYALRDAVVVEGTKDDQRPESARPVYDRAERGYGAFRRVFELPGPADLSRSEGSLRAGLLTIVVPHIADRRGRPRPVPVTALDERK